MYLNTKQTLSKIDNFNGIVAIWGLSVSTKIFLDKAQLLKSKITYIIDINDKLHNSYYKGIKIIKPEELLTLKHILVILMGGHTLNIRQFLDKHNINNYIINYSLSINYIPSNIIIKIDKLQKNYNRNDFNYLFCKKLIDILYDHTRAKLLIEHYTYVTTAQTPFKEVIKKQFGKKIVLSENMFYFSYHSIGKPNKQILRWKEGYLSNMITFDSKGYSGWSSLCDETINKLLKNISQKKANKYFDKLANKYIKNNQSKYIQPTNSDFKFPEENFIFFPLQTLNDSVMEHSYFNPLKLIKKVIKILSSKNIPLVIKQHPRCNDKELKKYLQKQLQKGKIILFNGSIHEAISKATTIYTINSGVGFESLLHLKPVVTFGKSDYMSMTKNINQLKFIEVNPFYLLSNKRKNKIKRFIYYYIKYKSVFINDDKKLKQIIFKVLHRYLKNTRG